MTTLSFRQLRIARSLAATLFDDGSGVPSDRLDYAMRELLGYISRVGGLTRLVFSFALWVLQITPFLLLGVWKKFTSLSPERRQRCLGKLEKTKLGLVVVLLKTVLSMVYFEHPEALAGTGYDAEGMHGPAWATGGRSPVVKLPVMVAPELESDEVDDLVPNTLKGA